MVADWELVSPRTLYQPVPRTFPEVREEESLDYTVSSTRETEDLPPEMEEMISGIETTLMPEEEQQLRDLVRKYRDIFAVKGEALGRTDVVRHEIDTGTARPIRMPPRRTPIHQVEVVEQAIEEMKKAGVIRPSDSPWSAPIVILKKKDGTCRFCVDFRRLNDVTVKDAYPLPRIEDNLDAMAGSRWFTTLDMASGYWQVEMSEEDRPKTAFATRYGLFEWNVMPFGLCNAPATFQRLMEKVMKGLQWRILALYLDDVVVFADTVANHLERLGQVWDRCRKAGLKLKPRKCQLIRSSVAFLGHVIDADGVHTDPDKVRRIQEWPVPRDLHQVRSFVGLTSYYRRFIQDYAKRAEPLHRLTKKDVPFEWTEETELAFQSLKEALIEPVMLAYPLVDGGMFVLDTDASGTAIGAVLSQVQGGEERVLAYGSRCLSSMERNYCTTRRELLAVVHFIVNDGNSNLYQ